ncbi:MAG: GNAT family N-acetyltransferase, partial [Dehalococcoidia bacterium]|nr:GNAT family N-acetyltransferase [Dehalococcoidia bacterium]
SGDFNTVHDCWTKLSRQSRDILLFSSPDWSELWWRHFGNDSMLHLGTVNHKGRCIGIAPMRIKEHTAYFIGSDDVCDFLDFIVEPGMEQVFFTTVLSHLAQTGIEKLDLSCLLPESSVRRYFKENSVIDESRIAWSQEDATVALDLPDDLRSYHAVLSGKQRHELLRKERRLNEEGDISYKISEKADSHDIDIFMHFFRESREDKNKFLTGRMEEFFRSVIDSATANRMLRLGLLELNNTVVAVTLGFDYQDIMYLYNSGYNPAYKWLSVGLLSKYYLIKHSIECNKSRFDFLKGNEKYKFYLGGKEVPLFRCIIKTIS